MNSRFDDLSRKAAAGALEPAEREWLDRYLLEHPDRRADLEWDAAFSAKLGDKVNQMPQRPGWERTARALQAEMPATRVAAPAVLQGPGVLDRLAQWLAATFGLGINLQAIAAALVLVQAGAIGILAWQHGDTRDSLVRSGAQDPTPRGPLLRVTFRADLREADLRGALASVGGEIVGGPGQIGVYLVRVKDGELPQAAQRLRASGTTELVEIVGARP